MKLSGPSGPGVRFIVGRPTRAVVTGIFPPEHPDVVALRIAVAASLADHQPAIDAALDRAQEAFEHEILYGRPGAVEPRGILRDESPIQTILSPSRAADPSPIWTGARRPASTASIFGFPVVEVEGMAVDEIRFANRQPVELDAFERDGKTVFTLRAVRP